MQRNSPSSGTLTLHALAISIQSKITTQKHLIIVRVKQTSKFCLIYSVAFGICGLRAYSETKRRILSGGHDLCSYPEKKTGLSLSIFN